MDRIGLVGISWKQGGADALARFTIPENERDERLPELARALGASELAYLATCNRVEIAFTIDDAQEIARSRRILFQELAGRAPEPGEAARTLRAYAGEGAVEHLFLVAAGLDSARPGETEVAGQFRAAHDRSRALGLIGTRLDLVFEHALRVAARVHRATGVGEGKVSLAEIAIERLRARFARTPGSLAAVGVSPMTERALHDLRGDAGELIVVNRGLERAERLARAVGGRARALDAFREEPDAVEAVILATGASGTVLSRPTLERLAARAPSGEPPLIVDMAVPPDVDPAESLQAGLERVGMNQIIAIAEEHRHDRLLEMADARTLVDDALVEIRRRIAERRIAPVLAALQRRYRRTAVEGAERLLRRDLAGIDDRQRKAVQRWAETLARRFAHIPTMGLRGLAVEGGSAAVDAFLEGLGDGLAEELQEGIAAAPDVQAPADHEEEP